MGFAWGSDPCTKSNCWAQLVLQFFPNCLVGFGKLKKVKKVRFLLCSLRLVTGVVETWSDFREKAQNDSYPICGYDGPTCLLYCLLYAPPSISSLASMRLVLHSSQPFQFLASR